MRLLNCAPGGEVDEKKMKAHIQKTRQTSILGSIINFRRGGNPKEESGKEVRINSTSDYCIPTYLTTRHDTTRHALKRIRYEYQYTSDISHNRLPSSPLNYTSTRQPKSTLTQPQPTINHVTVVTVTAMTMTLTMTVSRQLYRAPAPAPKHERGGQEGRIRQSNAAANAACLSPPLPLPRSYKQIPLVFTTSFVLLDTNPCILFPCSFIYPLLWQRYRLGL